MQGYTRMLRYIKPYAAHLTVSVLFMVLFSFLSTFSIWMISPFLGTLFSSDGAAAVTAPAAPGSGAAGGLLAGPSAGAGEAAGAAGAGVAGAQAPPAGGAAPSTAADAGGTSVGAGGQRAREIQRQVSGLSALRDNVKRQVDGWLLRGSKMESLWRICVVFFFLWLAKNLAGYVQSVLMEYVGLRIVKDMRDQLFAKFMRLPLTFFHRHRAGELISRATNDVLIANKCVNVSFTNLVRDPIAIVMSLGVAVLISWRLTLLALLVLPLSLAVIVRIGQKLRKYSHRQQEKLANLTAILQEAVTGVRVVKAFAMERFETAKFLAESKRLFRDMFKIARMQALSSPLTEQLSTVVGLFVLWYGGRQVLAGGDQLPPDLFILFLVCIFSLVHPVKELSGVNNGIQEGMAAAERIFAILDTGDEAAWSGGTEDLGAARGEVEFDHVTFAYDDGAPVLRDIALKVRPGEVVALVGASGAGKSTLVDLIPRFYDPQEGRVLIDGRDVRRFTLGSLRRAMGVVTQEVILFNETVRNNIAYGLSDVSDDQVVAAAKAANAHEFILQMPQGYDTRIGDRGVLLSGGQRQRISIARAILQNPPILIFDEATSALDTESELLVQEAIDRLVRDRTTFVIAHRLSTIQHVDRIYVLKSGRIVQTGTHAELLAEGGPYRVLHELQFRS